MRGTECTTRETAATVAGQKDAAVNEDPMATAQLEAELAAALDTLAELKRQMNQLHCEARGVTTTGAFCITQEAPTLGGNDVLPASVAAKLFTVFDGASVLDLGAGLGQYELYWRDMKARGDKGGPTSTRAYDGSENIVKATDGRVQHADLTQRQELGVEDWVMSIEVAEHIPKDLEPVFLDNLHRHNRKGLVISWARPDQPGHGHINGQEAPYVLDTFTRMGYEYQEELTKELRSVTENTWWLAQTLFVFHKSAAPA